VIGGGQYREDMNFNTYYFNHSDFGDFESKVNYDTIDTSAKTTYIFAQANLSVENFNISLGSRFSDHSIFGNSWTFEASPSLYFGNTLVYASLSSGFNPASLYQLYDPTQGFNAYTTRGNKNLKPEESISLELGVKKEFPSGSYVTLSAYRTETRNSIEYIYLWDKNTSIEALTYADNMGDTYLNVAKQNVSGLEVDGHVVYRKLYFHGNITWLDGQVTINPSDINTEQTGGNHVQLFNYGSFVTDEIKINKLIRRPRLVTNAEVGYKPISTLALSASYRYAGSRFDSGYDADLGPYGALNQIEVKYYHLIDLGINWDASKSFSVGLKLENIFNEDYQEIIGFQTRGRSAYLKLNFRW
jgi:vitamin B12 transporter